MWFVTLLPQDCPCRPLALDIVGGEEIAARFGSWVLDNTNANMSAIAILEERHPEWINVGCTAHGTSSAIKGLCDYRKTEGYRSITWGVEWLSDVCKQSNTMGNFMNDSGPAKHIVQHHQATVYGYKHQMTTGVPTRFGSNVFVMKSILASEAAFKQAASDERWANLGGQVTELAGYIQNEQLWVRLKNALQFLQAFNDFIHPIEADTPALGRV